MGGKSWCSFLLQDDCSSRLSPWRQRLLMEIRISMLSFPRLLVCAACSMPACVHLSFISPFPIPHSLSGQIQSCASCCPGHHTLKRTATDQCKLTEEEASAEAIRACSARPAQQGFPHGRFLHTKSCVPSIMYGHCGTCCLHSFTQCPGKASVAVSKGFSFGHIFDRNNKENICFGLGFPFTVGPIAGA